MWENVQEYSPPQEEAGLCLYILFFLSLQKDHKSTYRKGILPHMSPNLDCTMICHFPRVLSLLHAERLSLKAHLQQNLQIFIS